MNRRSFAVAGAAVLALSAQRVLGQVFDELSGVTIISELTGARIDLGNTGFAFHSRMLDEARDSEVIGFSSDTCNGAVRFVPVSTDPGTYTEERFSAIADQMIATELVGEGVFDDGAWRAMSALDQDGKDRVFYLEVQLGAFADYDLEVVIDADLDTFLDDLTLFQQIDLEGMEPFLFLDDSQVESLDFPVVTPVSSSRRRGSSGLTIATEEASTTNNVDSADVVEAVRDHQAQFTGELERYFEILDEIIEGGPEGEASALLFTDLMDLMLSWSTYPEIASELTFPTSLASLESIYFEWADGVGEVGLTMGAWMLGEGEIDAFMDALDVAVQLNTALSAELRTLGVVVQPIAAGVNRPLNEQVSAFVRSMSGSRAA